MFKVRVSVIDALSIYMIGATVGLFFGVMPVDDTTRWWMFGIIGVLTALMVAYSNGYYHGEQKKGD